MIWMIFVVTTAIKQQSYGKTSFKSIKSRLHFAVLFELSIMLIKIPNKRKENYYSYNEKVTNN